MWSITTKHAHSNYLRVSLCTDIAHLKKSRALVNVIADIQLNQCAWSTTTYPCCLRMSECLSEDLVKQKAVAWIFTLYSCFLPVCLTRWRLRLLIKADLLSIIFKFTWVYFVTALSLCSLCIPRIMDTSPFVVA